MLILLPNQNYKISPLSLSDRIFEFCIQGNYFDRAVKATDVKHSVFLSSFVPNSSVVSSSLLRRARSHNPYTKPTSTSRGEVNPLEINLIELSFLLALKVT